MNFIVQHPKDTFLRKDQLPEYLHDLQIKEIKGKENEKALSILLTKLAMNIPNGNSSIRFGSRYSHNPLLGHHLGSQESEAINSANPYSFFIFVQNFGLIYSNWKNQKLQHWRAISISSLKILEKNHRGLNLHTDKNLRNHLSDSFGKKNLNRNLQID